MFILSNGSGLFEDYKSKSPSYMLPILETLSFVYKAFANINAFPLTFDSRLIDSEKKLFDLLKSLNPSTEAIELV